MADTVLRAVEEPEVGALSALVYQKTQGNPFFVNQFVSSLHARAWLWFDAEQGRWRWNLEQIRGQGITDNVAELMAERIAKLPAATQESLKRAACVGNRFSLETLSVIGEQSPRQAAAALWEAVQQGLLLPIGEGYKYVQSAEAEPSLEDARAVRYEFLHDRVREAAYSLFGEEPSRQLHLRIGRLLLESTPEAQREGAIFDVVNQLNRAAGLLHAADEREELARLNLQAGTRAKASSAYAQALEYLRVGTSLLREDCWSGQYTLSFQLHRHRAECLNQTGQHEAADRDCELLLRQARSTLEKSDIYLLMVEMFVDRGQYLQAIQPARDGLKVLGIELPEGAEALAAANTRERERLQANLEGRSVSDLADLPVSTDPEHRARILMLRQTLSYAAGVHPGLFELLSAMIVNLGIEKGHAPGSSSGYTYYALVLLAQMHVPSRTHAQAHDYGKLAVRLAERLDSAREKALVEFTVSTYVAPWFHPVDACLRMQEPCFRALLDVGMLFWAEFVSMHMGVVALLGP
ncbi:MAG TPA: histidine kinase, partial [Archangium sp.]